MVLSSAISWRLAGFAPGASPETELEADKMNLVDKAMQTEGDAYSLVRGFFMAILKGQEIPGKVTLIGLGNTSCRKVLKGQKRLPGAAMKGEIPVQTGDVQLSVRAWCNRD